MMSEKEVIDAFPCPSYWKYQKETTLLIRKAFNNGVRCILLDAPTGSGKSIINTTFARLMSPAFYASPQLSQIDQVREGKHIGRYFKEVKGRRNYFCKYDPMATCDVGLCYRVKDFKCERSVSCPYFIVKLKALESPSALMSFAYLILEGYTETTYSFGTRNLLILDESHSIDRYLINHVNVRVGPYSLPTRVYEAVMGFIRNFKTLDGVKDFIMTVSEMVAAQTRDYEMITLDGKRLTIEQGQGKRKLEDFLFRADRFLSTCDDSEWVWDMSYRQTKKGLRKLFIAEPLYARYLMKDIIWNKADYFILSSATFLDPHRFIRETGLDLAMRGDEIMHLKVPSTFPVENRPIVNALDGKLIYKNREENLPIAVEILEGILDKEEGVNVAVHCHSYKMMIDIENLIKPKYRLRLITHTSRTRKEALERWKMSRGKVFLCVSFEEGYDWVGDICEAQVLFKVPYMNIKDRRVARRLEKGEWRWYYLETLKTVIQSYGRAVRTPDDKARFYVIDLSFLDIIRRERKVLPDWFKEALPKEWR